MKARKLNKPADVCEIMRNTCNISFLSNSYYMPPKDSHRNSPCPCGSGKKYKRCCYGKEPKANTPPKFIKDWNDLVGLESETHRLEIDTEMGCGWIRPKEYANDDESFMNSHYLSTHTFYGSSYKGYEKLLRSLGFNVVLDNWDKEQE